MPQHFIVSTPIYARRPFDDWKHARVKVVVDIDFVAEKFILIPSVEDIENSNQAALETMNEYLVTELGQRNVPENRVPVYAGTP